MLGTKMCYNKSKEKKNANKYYSITKDQTPSLSITNAAIPSSEKQPPTIPTKIAYNEAHPRKGM